MSFQDDFRRLLGLPEEKPECNSCGRELSREITELLAERNHDKMQSFDSRIVLFIYALKEMLGVIVFYPFFKEFRDAEYELLDSDIQCIKCRVEEVNGQ